MILTRVHPAPAETLDLDAPASRDRLLEWYRPRSADWLRINLVMSITGSAAGVDGTSETLTNATDRRILGVIRELSDVVLVGAASVRAEGYQLPRRARLAVATTSGDLAGHRLDAEQQHRLTIVCPQSVALHVAAEFPRAEVLTIPDSAPVTAIPTALRAAGHRSIVCEGGPSLSSALLGADAVDELCLTTAPLVREPTLPAFGPSTLPEKNARLEQLLLDESSYVFTRWSLRAA